MSLTELNGNMDKNGDIFQEYVVDWLNRLSGKIVTYAEVKGTHGHDIIYRGLKLEVKGVNALVRTKKKPITMSRFGFCKKYLRLDLDAIAFVIYDEDFIQEPKIVLIQPLPVIAYVKTKRGKYVPVTIIQVKKWIQAGYKIHPAQFARRIHQINHQYPACPECGSEMYPDETLQKLVCLNNDCYYIEGFPTKEELLKSQTPLID